MLLGLCASGSVIDNGSARDHVGAAVNHHRRINESAGVVAVAGADFGELTGRARYWILMAFGAGRGIKHRTEPGAGVALSLEFLLVESIIIAGRFRNTIARALGALV